MIFYMLRTRWYLIPLATNCIGFNTTCYALHRVDSNMPQIHRKFLIFVHFYVVSSFVGPFIWKTYLISLKAPGITLVNFGLIKSRFYYYVRDQNLKIPWFLDVWTCRNPYLLNLLYWNASKDTRIMETYLKNKKKYYCKCGNHTFCFWAYMHRTFWIFVI